MSSSLLGKTKSLKSNPGATVQPVKAYEFSLLTSAANQ